MKFTTGRIREIIAEEWKKVHEEERGHVEGSPSVTRPGEEDYTGHKGDKSKTHPGHIDYDRPKELHRDKYDLDSVEIEFESGERVPFKMFMLGMDEDGNVTDPDGDEHEVRDQLEIYYDDDNKVADDFTEEQLVALIAFAQKVFEGERNAPGGAGHAHSTFTEGELDEVGEPQIQTAQPEEEGGKKQMADVTKALKMMQDKVGFLLKKVDQRIEKQQFLDALLEFLGMIPADMTKVVKQSIMDRKEDAKAAQAGTTAPGAEAEGAATTMKENRTRNIRIKLRSK
jgi:hypothetical protein